MNLYWLCYLAVEFLVESCLSCMYEKDNSGKISFTVTILNSVTNFKYEFYACDERSCKNEVSVKESYSIINLLSY